MNRAKFRRLGATKDGVRQIDATIINGNPCRVAVDPTCRVTLGPAGTEITCVGQPATVDDLRDGDLVLFSGQPALRLHIVRA